ncbi:FYDLN acid domain-containing protein [Pelagibacteraceae bacterium]|nr:FYDLN acid domain-containing protein [Pelagibacteraceae bacterium]
MPKLEWGKKIVCPECSSKFYDLNKKYPVECPGCGVFIALNEMLQYGSDAKKVHEDDLGEEEIGNLVGDDATESLSEDDILVDGSNDDISEEETISLNDADDDLGVIVSDEEDLNIEDAVDVSIDDE